MILIHITTVPDTFVFFRGQIAFLKQKGFEVHAISSPGKLLAQVGNLEEIPVHGVNLSRSITPMADLLALNNLYKIFRSLKPSIVHAHTPKGGLLGVIAARLARIPVVVYGMRGLPYVTTEGLKRQILIWSETVACRLADRVIANSLANKERAIEMGFCREEKIRVLAAGSSNGVDAEVLFNPDQLLGPENRKEVRRHHRIPLDALVLGYMGRIVRDKGIIELEAAWQILRPNFPELYLLLVGPIEPQDPLPSQVMERLRSDPRVCFAGQTTNPASFYSAMDVLSLPTHREGFPNTPLEAAAMELPVVATSVDGCPEAVVDGVTGLLVPPFDSHSLALAIQQLLEAPDMRHQMGQAGRQRVLRDFRPRRIWGELYREYLSLLTERSNHFTEFP